MRCYDQNARPMGEILKPSEGLFHKHCIPRADGLIEQQDFRIPRGGYCESEPQAHTGRIGAHRHIEIAPELCELAYFFEMVVDLAAREAPEDAAHPDILDACSVHAHS